MDKPTQSSAKTTPSSSTTAEGSTKTAQRRARQERARAAREAERRSARRKKQGIIAAVVVVVLVVAVGIGIAVGTSRSGGKGPLVSPTDAVTTGSPIAVGGMLVGRPTAPVTLDLYEDFTCPVCGQFEKADGATVASLISSGRIKVRYHMLSFIDDKNGSTYSHRSAGAFAAADTYGGADKALALHTALYANQPNENSSAGLTNSKIIQLASDAGITSQQFVDAVTKNSYAGWVSQVADDGSKAGVTGTPTIFINEKQVELQSLANSQGQLDPAKLTQAIADAK
ncbi:MAG TPA: thioredoxin domain-containing protein [Frankiaceae bacterium]|nr:thioredoxin domain-containing protein [Frankiaceae bacterium]